MCGCEGCAVQVCPLSQQHSLRWVNPGQQTNILNVTVCNATLQSNCMQSQVSPRERERKRGRGKEREDTATFTLCTRKNQHIFFHSPPYRLISCSTWEKKNKEEEEEKKKVLCCWSLVPVCLQRRGEQHPSTHPHSTCVSTHPLLLQLVPCRCCPQQRSNLHTQIPHLVCLVLLDIMFLPLSQHLSWLHIVSTELGENLLSEHNVVVYLSHIPASLK